ncbi:hypothetical protein [Paenibacillus pinihumi]|uniref:hypothetical protein n=1 Tax=Paenibacillus pinihumi TaxID=669462 RepID=UPI0004078D46|nr:hypothetical protein [Paenibacillus pinihumi]
MKRKMVALIALFALVTMLAACTSQKPVDLDDVEVNLTTEPGTVTAGNPVHLKAAFTGMTVPDEATVTFDTRIDNKPVLFDATNEGNGVFTASFTFPEKGIQTVYVHFYVDDIHLTKQKWVEVK